MIEKKLKEEETIRLKREEEKRLKELEERKVKAEETRRIQISEAKRSNEIGKENLEKLEEKIPDNAQKLEKEEQN